MDTEQLLREAADVAGFKRLGCNWIPVAAFHPEILPRVPGCYAIYVDDELIYIGQTSNLRSRIRSHKLGWDFTEERRLHVLTRWGWGRRIQLKVRVSRRFGDWLMYEARLIRRLRPRYNRDVPGTWKKKSRRRRR